MTRVAIIAAMPGELKPLVRGWPHSTRNNVHFWAKRDSEEEWMAACAGTGQSAATRAFAAIEDGGSWSLRSFRRAQNIPPAAWLVSVG